MISGNRSGELGREGCRGGKPGSNVSSGVGQPVGHATGARSHKDSGEPGRMCLRIAHVKEEERFTHGLQSPWGIKAPSLLGYSVNAKWILQVSEKPWAESERYERN